MRAILIITALLLICAAAHAGDPPTTLRGIARITDGDTIRLGPVRVRLEGIDAPEVGQQCSMPDGTPWACGSAATKYAAELAGGRMVESVIIGLDKYRRLLGTCSILDATSQPDGPSLNERMVAAGFAVAYTRFSQAYVEVETAARTARRGLWQDPFEMPWDVRARQKAERAGSQQATNLAP